MLGFWSARMSARLLGQAPVTVSASLVSQEGRLGSPAQQGVAMEPASSPIPWNNIFMSLGAGRDTPRLFDPYSGPTVPKGPNGIFLLMSALALGES